MSFHPYVRGDLSYHPYGGHNGREGKGPGTSPSGWADAGSNPGVSKEG